MTVLPLIVAPDPFLDQPSQELTQVTDETRQLLDDMLDTMYANHGIGLAAVQVGLHQKAIVVDVDWKGEDPASRQPRKLINAKISTQSDTLRDYQEGCLSFPEQYSDVTRPDTISIDYLDEHGKAQTLQADGLLATCIQHEIDHTNGITFVQHLSRLKRDRILKKLAKMKKQGAIGGHNHDCGDPSCDIVHA